MAVAIGTAEAFVVGKFEVEPLVVDKLGEASIVGIVAAVWSAARHRDIHFELVTVEEQEPRR